MSGLTANDLAEMAETVEAAFTDTATVHAFISATQNSLGELEPSFLDVLGVACSIAYQSRYQYTNERGQVITLDCDALFRCSKSVDLEPRDEITTRGRRYKVDGLVEGRSVLIATLKAVDAPEGAPVVS
jgi:hypothetical protein